MTQTHNHNKSNSVSFSNKTTFYQCSNCDNVHNCKITRKQLSETRCIYCGVYLHDAEPYIINIIDLQI